MRTVEIPREAWTQTLDEFTVIHDHQRGLRRRNREVGQVVALRLVRVARLGQQLAALLDPQDASNLAKDM